MGPFLIYVAMLACACGGNGDGGPSPDPDPGALPTAAITVTSESGDISEELTVELALTPAEQAQGLMFRMSMPENRGMLFLFPAERRGGFWMRNTYIPLDIAYLAADGTVLEIIEGVPLDETPHRPAQNYRHVIELNQGWFERHGLGVGSKVSIPEEHVPQPMEQATATSPP